MIATVKGILLKKEAEEAVIDVNGIGILAYIPLSTFYSLPDAGKNVFLFTHLIVREDSMKLFGFLTESELEMFKVLIEINRIGPKLALSILSSVTAADLQQAVMNQDFRVLTSIPGIGKKSAERILFEIRDNLEKLGRIKVKFQGDKSTPVGKSGAEVVQVLTNLGYKSKEAERAVDQVLAKDGKELSVDEMIRKALKILAGRK